jgi:L-serine dehydratase
LFRRRETLPLHSNGMRFTARAADGVVVAEKIYYSVGGGFVVGADGVPDGAPP